MYTYKYNIFAGRDRYGIKKALQGLFDLQYDHIVPKLLVYGDSLDLIREVNKDGHSFLRLGGRIRKYNVMLESGSELYITNTMLIPRQVNVAKFTTFDQELYNSIDDPLDYIRELMIKNNTHMTLLDMYIKEVRR